MLKQVVIGALLFVPPCERPPVQYQGNPPPAMILFADAATVDAACREIGGLQGMPGRILACTNTKGRTMLMPNPCAYGDGYARLLCHEISHINGWRHANT